MVEFGMHFFHFAGSRALALRSQTELKIVNFVQFIFIFIFITESGFN